MALEFKRNQKACVEGNLKKRQDEFAKFGLKLDVDWDVVSKDENKNNIAKFFGYESQFNPASWLSKVFGSPQGVKSVSTVFNTIIFSASTAADKTSSVKADGKTLRVHLTHNFKADDGYAKGVGCGEKDADEIVKLAAAGGGGNAEFEKLKEAGIVICQKKAADFAKAGGKAELSFDWDAMSKDANCVNIAKFMGYSSQWSPSDMFQNFLKDDIGKEALNDAFTKIIFHPQSSTSKSSPDFSKDGKTLKVNMYFDWSKGDGYGNGGIGYFRDEQNKALEALL